MSGWFAALRIARREARRARGRAVLVIAMIALPVAAISFGLAVDQTFKLTPDARADRMMGGAQALVRWPAAGRVEQLPGEIDFVRTLEVDGQAGQSGQAGQPGQAEQPVPAVPAVQPSTERLLALLPPGTRAITDQSGALNLRTATGTAPITARLLDYADPLASGLFRTLSGRAPAAADEVAVTPAAASRLNVTEGGTVRLADGSRTFRVVGVVEDPEHLTATTVVLRPGALPSQALSGGELSWLVATPGPLTWDQVKQLNTHGVVAVSRHVLAHPPSAAEQYSDLLDRQGGDGSQLSIVTLIAGLVVLEVVLLAGPAFAVSARRRRRELALVAAAGGTPAQVRRIVLADGVVLGAVAAAAGVALGIVVAAAGLPLIEEHLAGMRAGQFRLPVTLAGVAGLAVVTGMLAAVVPAWISARQDVVAALTGRRGITRSSRRWPVIGGALVAAGAVVAAAGAWRTATPVILTGLVVAELGLVVCTPAIVGLVGRAGRWLPLAPRIALRDSSRNRTAAAPAVSAVMAAVVGSIAIAMVFTATNGRDKADHRSLNDPGEVFLMQAGKAPPGAQPEVTPQARAALSDIMPVEHVYQVRTPSCADGSCFVVPQRPRERECPYTPRTLDREPTRAEQRAARSDPRCADVGQSYVYFGGFHSDAGMTLVVAEEDLVPVAKIPSQDVAQVAGALRSGAVVVSDPRYLQDGRVTLMIVPARPSVGVQRERGAAVDKDDIRTVTAPGFVLPSTPRAPITLLTEDTARSLGLSSAPLVTMATTSRMPTVEEEDRLRAVLGDAVWAVVERPPAPDRATLIVLAVVAGVITLGAAAIATGLAAADGRADLATLAAVGASPRVRRLLSLSQAGTIAGLGSLLGMIAGLGASVAVLAAMNRGLATTWPAVTPYPITVPWLNVAVALVVVPLIAMLGAGLLTRSRLPIERRL